jgi:hypothetical protein
LFVEMPYLTSLKVTYLQGLPLRPTVIYVGVHLPLLNHGQSLQLSRVFRFHMSTQP